MISSLILLFLQLRFDPERESDTPMGEDKGSWIRVPFAGRLEVRVKENRFTLKDAFAEIVSRRWTVDNSQLVKRQMTERRGTQISRTQTQPVSPLLDELPASGSALGSAGASATMLRNQSTGESQIGLPGGMSELPAALSALTTQDSKSPPAYPHSEVGALDPGADTYQSGISGISGSSGISR
jgi:hypothetical protein